jgi:putative transposase
LREAEAGLPIKALCRQHGFSEASDYLWRSRLGGVSVSDAKRLKEARGEKQPAEEVARRIDAPEKSDGRFIT